MSTREIQGLRTKFIAVAMLSIFLAMLFIGITVNAVAFAISRASVDRTLTELINGARRIEEEKQDYKITISQIFAPDYGLWRRFPLQTILRQSFWNYYMRLTSNYTAPRTGLSGFPGTERRLPRYRLSPRPGSGSWDPREWRGQW